MAVKIGGLKLKNPIMTASGTFGYRDDLDELIRKHDYRFRSEVVTGAEADSWERAVAAVVGESEPARDK